MCQTLLRIKVKSESNLHVLYLLDANNGNIIFSFRVICLMLFLLFCFEGFHLNCVLIAIKLFAVLKVKSKNRSLQDFP